MKLIERIRNLHRFDQTFRFVGGLFIVIPAALGMGFLDETILRYPILVFGIVNIISAATGWCVVYHLLGVSSYDLPDKG